MQPPGKSPQLRAVGRACPASIQTSFGLVWKNLAKGSVLQGLACTPGSNDLGNGDVPLIFYDAFGSVTTL